MLYLHSNHLVRRGYTVCQAPPSVEGGEFDWQITRGDEPPQLVLNNNSLHDAVWKAVADETLEVSVLGYELLLALLEQPCDLNLLQGEYQFLLQDAKRAHVGVQDADFVSGLLHFLWLLKQVPGTQNIFATLDFDLAIVKRALDRGYSMQLRANNNPCHGGHSVTLRSVDALKTFEGYTTSVLAKVGTWLEQTEDANPDRA